MGDVAKINIPPDNNSTSTSSSGSLEEGEENNQDKGDARRVGKKRKKVAITVCLTNCRYDVIRRTVAKFGFKEVGENGGWSFYWTDLSISLERCKDMKRYQRINHFPGMLEICRKDLLARNLNRMLRLFPKDYSFFPRTWCLPADLGEALTYSRLRKNKTFIMKPDAGSQGKGICILRNLRDVKPSDRMVCQVYVARPFLIDGYKFDLRVYIFITSCDPLRIYVYNEGLVRFATSRYKEPTGVNITNFFMHLTNYAVNRHSRTYNTNSEAGSKRRLTWFNNYIRDLGHDADALWKRIDDIIIKTTISAWPVLKHSYVACFPNHDVVPACCELLGIDILLDRRLNPYVLEVNHSPSFHTDTQLDCEVKEALLEDMLAMLNLEQCDKRKIMRQDRKRVQERLLHGSSREAPPVTDPRSFTQYYRHEMAHIGGFRLVYPTARGEHTYAKFFNQGQASLYGDTACSRARENASAALRDEMVLKAKMEASKRAPVVAQPPKSIGGTPLRATRHTLPTLPVITLNSFLPQMIVDGEEKERLQKLTQREMLVRGCGLTEHIYFAMQRNGALRPYDEMKYSFFRFRDRTAPRPAIADLIEEIRSKKD